MGGGHVVKRTRAKGRGDFPVDCPLEDSTVRVHLRVGTAAAADAANAASCLLPENAFLPAPAAAREQGRWAVDTRGPDGAAAPREFDTGMGEAPEAVDMAVRLMLRGEVAAVRSSWQYAYEGRDDAPQVRGQGEGGNYQGAWDFQRWGLEGSSMGARGGQER